MDADFNRWSSGALDNAPAILREIMETDSGVGRARAARLALRLSGALGMDEAPPLAVRRSMFGADWQAGADTLAGAACEALERTLEGDGASARNIALRTLLDLATEQARRDDRSGPSAVAVEQLLADSGPIDGIDDDPFPPADEDDGQDERQTNEDDGQGEGQAEDDAPAGTQEDDEDDEADGKS